MKNELASIDPGVALALQETDGVLLKCNQDSVEILSEMLEEAKKRKFVKEHHTRSIVQISSGKKTGRWKTYLGNPRKEVLRNTEKELIEYLYNYYMERDCPEPTYADIFEDLMDYKLNMLNRELKTIKTDRGIFNRFESKFAKHKISEITEEMLLEWIREAIADQYPTPNALKRLILQMRNVFDFAVRKRYCAYNPARNIDIGNYAKSCNLNRKSDEDKAFSLEELSALEDDANQHKDNPRALMILLAKETGMRAGEMPALLWEDIDDDYIHIHRQQLLDDTVKGKRTYTEVQYTKNERTCPDDGRLFPITDPIKKVLDRAKLLPGKSEYVFHDQEGDPIRKDSYELYLRRRCRILGMTTTNNHAFRMSLNSRFIDLGLNASQRALLLGHTVRTNELHYSLTDRRRMKELSAILRQSA